MLTHNETKELTLLAQYVGTKTPIAQYMYYELTSPIVGHHFCLNRIKKNDPFLDDLKEFLKNYFCIDFREYCLDLLQKIENNVRCREFYDR